MRDKVILVGASGTIGSATLQAARGRGMSCTATYQSRSIPGGIRYRMDVDSPEVLDIRPGDRLLIFAAFSDQEWIRLHPEEAFRLNVSATTRLIEHARSRRAHVVFMSTEAVFGRESASGWTESAEPCPTTEYGRQKVAVESVMKLIGGGCVVRTGWNVAQDAGHRCVVRNTYAQLLGGEARLAEDNVFSLTDVADTARVLLHVAMERHEGTVHAVSGTPITRTALGDAIIAASRFGRDMRYQRIRFNELCFAEPRAASAWLTRTVDFGDCLAPFSSPSRIVAGKVPLLDDAGTNAMQPAAEVRP